MGIDTTVPDDGDPLTPAPGVAFEADGTVTTAGRLVVTGNLGGENALSLAGTALTNSTGGAPFTFADGTNAAGIESDPAGESVHTSFVAYDSLGTPITVDVTAVLEDKADTGNTWRFFATSGDDTDANLSLGNGTLTFDGDGKLIDSTGTTVTVDRADTGAASPLSLALDFSSMTSLTSRDSDMVMTSQDGSEIGNLTSFSVGTDGTISGSYSNGQVKTLGALAVAVFKNNAGLVDKGGNQFIAGTNSGEPVITSPLSLGSGGIRSGALEGSNVDLSEEFINMIISSTGFSASSRVITTSDQLITELLNSTR
jgi:flagellar hook protein FlgE